ncbi:MAG: mechanosensitive ion channel [Cyanobacteriota bacterium]|nr:mechanosensitive ion channel [Cyanobacteriota bacterium]
MFIYTLCELTGTAKKIQDIVTEVTVEKLTEAVIIILVAYVSIKILEKLINWLSERVVLQLRQSVKQSLPFWQFIVVIISLIWISNIFFKLSLSNVIALSGVVGVALGFAFKDYASSVIAGIVALLESPYRVGDRVKIGEHYGEIVRFGLRSFSIQTTEDNNVTVPHNYIWTNTITNVNDGDLEAQVITDFYVSHEVDVKLARRILYQAAYTSKYTQMRLPIFVSLEEKMWGTHFQIKAYPIDARAELAYKSDLTWRVKEAFGKYAITYPQIKKLGKSE